MSGTYTIDGSLPSSGTNYATFSAFEADLTTLGVNGPVLVNVAEGTYNEQVEFTAVTGASGTNTITIQSDPSNSTKPELEFSNFSFNTNYVMGFDGASHFIIDGLSIKSTATGSYSRVIDFDNGNDHIIIRNCDIEGPQKTTTSNNNALIFNNGATSDQTNHVEIRNNHFTHGTWAIYWFGSSTTKESGSTFIGNTFEDFGYRAIWLDWQTSARVDSNTISQNSTFAAAPFGIMVKRTDTVQISFNSILLKGTSSNTGIAINACASDSLYPGMVYNNTIVTSDVNTGGTWGINVFGCTNLKVLHNSVNIRAGDNTKGAFFTNHNNGQPHNNIEVKNNIFCNNGGGLAFFADAKITTSNGIDHSNNLYYTSSSTGTFKMMDSTFTTLADFQTFTGKAQNSVQGDPIFSSPTDLHVLGTNANDAGDNSVGINVDYEGDARPLSPSTQVDIGADEFAPASCFPATQFSVASVFANQATFTWNSDASNTSFAIQYGAPGFALGSGTVQTTTDTFYTITGLTGNSQYEVYLLSYCGATDSTTWNGPISISTPCSMISSFPFTENFDGTSWVPTTGSPYNSTLDPCWSSTPNTTASGVVKWVVNSGSTLSSSTGPSGDYNGSGNYMYIETSSGASWSAASLLSPMFDLSSLTVPQLTIFTHRYGATSGRFTIMVHANGVSDTLFDDYGQVGNFWEEKILSMAAYANDTVQLEVIARKATSYTGDIAIDNLIIEETPPCPKPSGITFSNRTSSSMDLDFQSTGTAFTIEYGPAGFAQGTGVVITANSNPFTVTGLNSNTQYSFYVRNDCTDSLNGYSTWVGPYTWKTLCGEFTATYTNNFDLLANNTKDFCWAFRNFGTGGGSFSRAYAAPTTYAVQPVSAPNIYRYNNGSNTHTRMISPAFSDLDSNVNQISFYSAHDYSGSTGTVYLLVGTTEDPDSVNSFVIADTIFPQYGTMNQYVVLLDSVPAGHKFIAFEHSNNATGVRIALDDFEYSPIPACIPPSLAIFDTITDQSVTLSWTGGDGSSWDIEYGPSGFSQGTGVMVSGLTQTTDTITGLTGNTCYDVYIRGYCGTNPSIWYGPVTVCTECGIETAPWLENFESTHWTPTTGSPYNSTFDKCWNPTPSTGNVFKWVVNSGSTASSSTGPNNGRGGSGNFLYTEASYNGNASLKTPDVDITTLSNPFLSFYHHMYGSNMGDLHVAVWNGSSHDTLLTLSGQQHTGSGAAWTKEWVDLSGYSSPVSVTFFARRGSSFQGDMAIDDVAIGEGPACIDPNQITLNHVTPFEASLSWLPSSSAIEYYVEYGPTGFSQGSGIGMIDTVYNAHDTLLGLLADSCYDVYVSTLCGSTGAMTSWVGPFTFCTDPTCPKPTQIQLHQVTTQSVSLSWVTGGSSHWQYVIGTGNQPTGQVITTSLDSITIGNLNPATTYKFWVRDSCSAIDLSDWSGPFTFTTECVAYAMPYQENFNGMQGTQLLCWDSNGGNRKFNKFTFNGNSYAEARFYNWPSGDVAVLTSPEVTITGRAHMILSYSKDYWSLYPHDSLYVLSKTASMSTWDTVAMYGGPSFNTPGASFTIPAATMSVDTFALDSSYVGHDVQIRLRAVSDFGPDLFIGRVVIDFDPAFITCPKPTGLMASAVTDSSALLSWGNGGAGNYQIVMDTAGFALGTSPIINTTTASYQANGLSPWTNYQFYVREICTPGDTSQWSLVYGFKTQCSPLAFPFYDGFDNWVAQPNGTKFNLDPCWQKIGQYPNLRYIITNTVTPTPNTGPTTDVSSTGAYAYFEASNGAPGDSASLVTPAIDMTGSSTPYLTFYSHFYGADIDKMHIMVWANQQWNIVDTIVGQQQTTSAAPWTKHAIDLSAFAAEKALRVQFKGYKGASATGDMAIDEVSIFDSITMTCNAPTNVQALALSCDSVVLGWQSGTYSIMSKVLYDVAGFDPNSSGTAMWTSDSSLVINGLSPGTTYDVYVSDSCAMGMSPTASFTFTTPNAPTPSIQYTWNISNVGSTSADINLDATGTSQGVDYTWSGSFGSVSGMQGQVTYNQNGTDTIHLMVSNACGSSDTSFVVTINGIGIGDIEGLKTMVAFPNPTSEILNVELEGISQTVEFSLINSLGKELRTKTQSGPEIHFQWNVQNLPPGIYILRARTKEDVITEKISIR
ncbi:MAG: hypothetical protein SchgKO_25550 [Schleiferiaceae bacterium]